jgi:predicted acylesterase/phospholipase RssA
MIQDVKREWPTIVTRVVELMNHRFVCVRTALNMTGPPRLFRTYLAPKYPTFNCKIWEAARATSAAPTFFERIIIGLPGTSEPYLDGGMGCNNPIKQVLEEAEAQFPGRHVACVVSIGTGQSRPREIPRPNLIQRVFPLTVVEAIQQIATDCERSAQEIALRFQNTPNFYFRFNVEQGLQDIGLANWERLDKVTTHTGQYIRMPDVDKQLGLAVAAIHGRQRVVATEKLSTVVADLHFNNILTIFLQMVFCYHPPARYHV